MMSRDDYVRDKIARLEEFVPDWRACKHPNGQPKYAPDGTMLNDDGTRSIFDDVDE